MEEQHPSVTWTNLPTWPMREPEAPWIEAQVAMAGSHLSSDKFCKVFLCEEEVQRKTELGIFLQLNKIKRPTP